MVNYHVLVSTGNLLGAGTLDSIYLSLVGTEGKSPKTVLQKWGPEFFPGSVSCVGWNMGSCGTGVEPFAKWRARSTPPVHCVGEKQYLISSEQHQIAKFNWRLIIKIASEIL